MKKIETPNLTTTKTSNRRAAASRCLAATAAAVAILPASVNAQTAAATGFSPHFDALVNMEFANEYVTPRGMMVTDRGLTFQPLLLGLLNIYKGDGFINDFTLVPGVWNDFSSSAVSVHGGSAYPKTDWIETDPIAGLSFTFAKKFKLDVTYTAFNMHILDIGTSQHLDTKLSYDDSDYLKKFALHPYFEFWQELENKATDADLPASLGIAPRAGARNPEPGSSYYFEVGVAPGYTFENVGGLRLEAPARVLLPNSRFYGDFYAPSSTVGLWEIGGKASLPVKFMPEGMGHWGVHAGIKYLNFVDDNLYRLNQFNQPDRPIRSTVQIYCGASIFF